MSKKKKKNHALTYSPESVSAVKKQLKTFNWKRVITIALSTIAAFAVYEAVLSFEEQQKLGYSIIMPIYYVIVTILVIVVVFLNHGFSKKQFTPDMLREDVPEDEALRICAKLNRHKALAKKFMLVLIPFMLALLLDIIYLFYGDMLSAVFKMFVPNS
ncbi:MAG: hypothetical protein HFE63_05320 [Clostridiales bacterium]|nr:hypothetical protein [Clostridiales bacterium]